VNNTQRGIEVRLLGPPEVAVAGAAVEVGSAKQRALLAALALHPSEIVSTERLVDALWGDDPPESAQTTLRSLVYRLRRTLTGGDGDGPGWLSGKGSGYQQKLGLGGKATITYCWITDYKSIEDSTDYNL